MTLQRSDRLKEPPIVGKWYMVPTVFEEWHRMLDHWPIMGPLHEDTQFINFSHNHYHLDGRFLTQRQRNHAEVYGFPEVIQSAPLHADFVSDPHAIMPAPVLRRKRCWTNSLEYTHHHREPIGEIAKHFAGHQCKNGTLGWICPHKHFPLGSVKAIDGVLTCPLHGMRIDALTGKCLGPA